MSTTKVITKRLARLVRIGPRKRLGLLAVLVVLVVVGLATGSVLAVLLLAVALFAMLVGATLVLELRRWRRALRSKLGAAQRDAAAARARREAEATRAAELESKLASVQRDASADQARRHAEAVALRRQVGDLQSKLEAAKRDADDDRTWRDARATLTLATGRRRTRVLVFPMTGVNDYFKLIYQEFPRYGFDVVPVGQEAGLDGAQPGDVVHFHWTKRVQTGCTSADEARAASASWLERFRALQERGVTVIWGVHEALPHECPFPDVEQEFRQALVDLVDIVQVLHPSTNDVLADLYRIPVDKTLVVPHPLYTGAQADHVTRHSARADLGFGANDLLLLGLGSVRPYKGYERVIRMLPSLQTELGDRGLTFVIAGPAQWDPRVREYIASLADEIRRLDDPTAVRMSLGPVPGNHLQRLLRATDVSVAPYRSGLNSGVLMMNLTFGVPTVIASNEVTDDIAASGPVTTFPPDDDDALRRALLDALTATSVRPVDPAFLAEHAPTVVSATFAERLREHLRQTAEERTIDAMSGATTA